MTLNTNGKSDPCKGCVVCDECGLPYHELEEDIERCPCNRCLVKMVCDASPCSDYSKFVRGLRMPVE